MTLLDGDGVTGDGADAHTSENEFDIIDAPKREGYTFVYWKGSEYQPGDKYTVAEDHVFTAQWKKNGSDTQDGTDDTDANDPSKDTGKDSDKSGKGVKTGDETDLLLLLLLLLASGSAVMLMTQRRRRAGKIDDRRE